MVSGRSSLVCSNGLKTEGSSAGRIGRMSLRDPRSSGQEEALLSGLTLADGDQKFHKWSSLVSP